MMNKTELAALRRRNNAMQSVLRRLQRAGTPPAYADDGRIPSSEVGHPSRVSEMFTRAADAATAWGTSNLSDPDDVAHLNRHEMLVESTRSLGNDWGVHWASLDGRTDGPDAGNATDAANRRAVAAWRQLARVHGRSNPRGHTDVDRNFTKEFQAEIARRGL
jgi:hypothetical protein